MSLEQEYIEYIGDIIEKLDASVLLYGSTACGKQTSDLDVVLIVKDYSKDDFEKLKSRTIQFQIDRNMILDDEVPYENKLIYRDSEVQDMLSMPPFEQTKGARYNIKPIQRNEEYLKSNEMRARLLTNILTAKSNLLIGNKNKIDKYKKKAWEIIIKSVMSYNELETFSLDELIELLHKDKITGMAGELYLGYKNNMPEKVKSLYNDAENALNNLILEGKIEKDKNGIYIIKEKLYENDIKKYKENTINFLKKTMVDSKKSYENPRIIFVGGLPASGKTLLGKKIEMESFNEEFVCIDTDYYREYCPNLKKLKQTPQTTAVTTAPFANEVELELLKYALEHHKNIIQLSSLRATDIMDKLVKTIKERYRDYKIDVAVLAVPFDECLLSAQERYEQQITSKDETCVPRFVKNDFLKTTQEGCLKTLSLFEKNNDIHSISIYKRGKNMALPEKVYCNKDTIQKYRNSVEAFCKIQLQESKNTTLESMLARCKTLNETRKKRNATKDELQPIAEIIEKSMKKMKSIEI